MTLKEKINYLKDNKLISIIEIEKKNPNLTKFALYYYLKNAKHGTTQYNEIDKVVNELIEEKIEKLKSLLE